LLIQIILKMNSLSPKILILIGFIIMVVGLSWMYAGKYFQWLGKLPGDIKIEKEHFRFYFPLTTMVLVSLFFSLVVKLLKWMGLL